MRGGRTYLCCCLRGTSVRLFLDGCLLRTSFYLPRRCVLPTHRECTIYPCPGCKALKTLHCGYHFIGGLVYICKNKQTREINQKENLHCISNPIFFDGVPQMAMYLSPPPPWFVFVWKSVVVPGHLRWVQPEEAMFSILRTLERCSGCLQLPLPQILPSVRVSRSNADLVLSFILSGSYDVCLSHFNCFLGLGW